MKDTLTALLRGRRSGPITIAVLSVALLALLTEVVLPGPQPGTRGVGLDILFQGLCYGIPVSLSAAGLVLIYQSGGFINFAQISLGAVGAEIMIQLTRFTGTPFYLAVLLGLALAAVTGIGIELAFVRWFARSPRLILTIVTVIITYTIIFSLLPLVDKLGFLPPIETRPKLSDLDLPVLKQQLPFSGLTFHVGHSALPFGFPELFSLQAGIVGILVLLGFLRFTRAGVAARGASQNSERAELLGISVGALSTAAWAVAGLLSGLAMMSQMVTVAPGVAGQSSFVALLLPLSGAVIARFRSFSVAIYSTLLLSILQSAINRVVTDHVTLNLGINVAVIAAGLALTRGDSYRLAAVGGDFAATGDIRPIPRELASLGVVRGFRYGFLAVAAIAVVALPFVAGISDLVRFQAIALEGVVALSLVVLTGWMGQVSLGQYAFVALAAVVTGDLAQHAHVPFLIAVPIGVAASAALAVGIGIPALRVRGVGLAVLTFAVAALFVIFLFDSNIFGSLKPDSVNRPRLFFIDLDNEKVMYAVCVLAFVVVALLVTYLRRTRVGRLLIASRDNEATLQSLGVPLLRTKVLGFAIAGAIAGLAGSLIVYQSRGASADAFPVDLGILLFVYVVLGGISSVTGAVIGALYLGISTDYLGSSLLATTISHLTPLIIVFVAPGGLTALLSQARDGALRIIAQRRQLVVKSLLRAGDAEAIAARLVPMQAPSLTSGLAALPPLARWAKESHLHGEAARRAEQRAASSRREAAALTAVAEAAADTDRDFTRLDPPAGAGAGAAGTAGAASAEPPTAPVPVTVGDGVAEPGSNVLVGVTPGGKE